MLKLGVWPYTDDFGNRWHVYYGNYLEDRYHIGAEVNHKKNTITYWGKKKDIPYCDKCGRPWE